MNYQMIANNKLKDKSILYGIRRNMVEYYYTCKSYRKTASLFEINVKTVVKWVNRFKEKGLEGLRDLPRTPKKIHNKTRKEVEDIIVKLRRESHFGARRLKEEFELPVSVGAISRILKVHGLTKKIRKRYKKKRDLREEKMRLKPFERIQVDIKYLNDIPDFYKYYYRYKLPKYQITARDVRTGGIYYFYSYEKSVTASIMALKILLTHLLRYGINVNEIEIQTDNGAEFSGNRIHHDRGFRKYLKEVWGIKHRYTPPSSPNVNADVEASHRLIEDEFYELEEITSKQDFIEKSRTYQFYFNFMRKNSYKGFKTPKDIIEEYNIPAKVLLLPPIILDDILYRQNEDFDINYEVYHHPPDHPA